MLSVWRLLVWLAMLMAVPALATEDPPARVGRVAVVEGKVTFHIDRRDAGSPANTNWPISGGAILETERTGRTEVQIGSSAFRLAEDSSLEFAAVDDQHIRLALARGSLAVMIRDPDQAQEIEVSAPAGQVRFGGPGVFRIDVEPGRDDMHVSSRDGTALVRRAGAELVVPGGQRATVYAGGGWFLGTLRQDAFDEWNDIRNAGADAGQARRYVSPQMTGYEDLDRYGEWNSTADYGTVWYPRAVPVDWAPYRYGRWAWVSPWGWTWIDEAPWGFAPFHYGRWLLVGGRWAWVPGAYAPRPVYAPALVGWVGNPGWSVNFSFGNSPAVGWFPLAPGEVFVPAYRSSLTYVRHMNVTQVTNVTVINQAVTAPPHRRSFAFGGQSPAVTVVPADTVRSGRPIRPGLWSRLDGAAPPRPPANAGTTGNTWLAPAITALRPNPGEGRTSPFVAPARRDPVPSPVTTQAPAGASPPPPQATPSPVPAPGPAASPLGHVFSPRAEGRRQPTAPAVPEAIRVAPVITPMPTPPASPQPVAPPMPTRVEPRAVPPRPVLPREVPPSPPPTVDRPESGHMVFGRFRERSGGPPLPVPPSSVQESPPALSPGRPGWLRPPQEVQRSDVRPPAPPRDGRQEKGKGLPTP